MITALPLTCITRFSSWSSFDNLKGRKNQHVELMKNEKTRWGHRLWPTANGKTVPYLTHSLTHFK